MNISPHGYRAVAVLSCVALVALGGTAWCAFALHPAFWFAAALPCVFAGWVLWFFRDPKRTPPGRDDVMVSPADGTVSDVTHVGGDSATTAEEAEGAQVKIGIFMSIFNVHVNRSPCTGRVLDVTYRPGAFLDARRPESSERNESVTSTISYEHRGRAWTVTVRQVAGMIARRIVTSIVAGREVAMGERIGMIKFGSRLELIVPRAVVGRVAVSPGQHVTAGETILIETA